MRAVRLTTAALLVSSTLALPSQRVLRSRSDDRSNRFAPTDYEVVPDIFAQSSGKSVDIYDPSASFGLNSGDWSAFRQRVSDLNEDASSNEAFKVIFVARHGEGYHNVAEAHYGTPAWNCYWAEQYTDGNITWGPDPLLTPLGISQAETARDAWALQLSRGAPVPQTIISSPLSRAASTLNITWSPVADAPKPVFHELFRESIGLHTCDQRRSRSYLAGAYPSFGFEDGFAEQDKLWTVDLEETDIQHVLRTRRALDLLFASDPSVFVSITAHGGTISSLLGAVGHPSISVGTGGMVPVVVKATRAQPFPTPDPGPSATAPACSPTARL